MSGHSHMTIPSNITAGQASMFDGNENDLSTVGTMGTITADDSSIVFDSSNASADGLVVLPSPPPAPEYEKPPNFDADAYDHSLNAPSKGKTHDKCTKIMNQIDGIRAEAVEAAEEQHNKSVALYTKATQYSKETQKFMVTQQKDIVKLSKQSNTVQLKAKEQATQISSLKKRIAELEKENNKKKTAADDMLLLQVKHLEDKVKDKAKEVDRVTKEKKELQSNHEKALKAKDDDLKYRIGNEVKQTEAKAAELKKVEKELSKAEKEKAALVKRVETLSGAVDKLNRHKDALEIQVSTLKSGGGGGGQKRSSSNSMGEYMQKKLFSANLETNKHRAKLQAQREDKQKKNDYEKQNRAEQISQLAPMLSMLGNNAAGFGGMIGAGGGALPGMGAAVAGLGGMVGANGGAAQWSMGPVMQQFQQNPPPVPINAMQQQVQVQQHPGNPQYNAAYQAQFMEQPVPQYSQGQEQQYLSGPQQHSQPQPRPQRRFQQSRPQPQQHRLQEQYSQSRPPPHQHRLQEQNQQHQPFQGGVGDGGQVYFSSERYPPENFSHEFNGENEHDYGQGVEHDYGLGDGHDYDQDEHDYHTHEYD
eukprot:scaffold1454_cov81-Skeletonema_dohrnii-CCMP3373.AAC.1